ncbi:MAG: SCP-like extracellular [Alphaproteobacteria bacterium]|nr:SCP-like extracellular [Alphaproteobacteria bacterium]
MGRIGKFSLLGSAIAFICATAAPLFASEASWRGSGEADREAGLQYAAYGFHRQNGFASRVLGSHNAERERLRLPGLKWNAHLEREAAEWAHSLGQRGVLEHAEGASRRGTGENLWMGTAGAWDVETMVGMFLAEREHYRHGAFPDVSRTGNWADVGHYTQIVWRDTREVGCAMVTARGNDVLVCRYYPAGNVWGARAF